MEKRRYPVRIPSLSILSFYSFYFILSTLLFPLSTKLQIALSVWKHIIHTGFENIGYLIYFKE